MRNGLNHGKPFTLFSKTRCSFFIALVFTNNYWSKDVNQLGLSASKLIEAKEIPIRELVVIQEEYEQAYLDSHIKFKDNAPCIEVNKESFEMWTRN